MPAVKKSNQRLNVFLNSEGESEWDGASLGSENEDHLLRAIPENVVALDCEMVGVGINKHDALARCSIVDYYGKVLFDKYVKPKRKITDYRTQWSGIRPSHMDNTIPFKVARKQVILLLKNKIVIGHALHFDMKILKIRRTCKGVRDTSKNVVLRKLAGFSLNETPSLRRLSLAILGRNIQTDTHCSVEDSKAAMDLYRTVEHEWDERIGENNSSKYLGDVFWPSWLDVKN